VTRVQFREDEDLVAYVEAQGENPNDVAKRAFEAEVRRMKVREARKKLAKLQLSPPDGASEIRRLRDD
jgi:hypothetical protein